VVGSALLSGILLDALLTLPEVRAAAPHVHGVAAAGWTAHAAALALLAVLLPGIVHALRARFASRAEPVPGAASLRLSVSGMSCSHCVDRVEKALKDFPGVEAVAVRLKPGEAVVTGKELDAERLAETVNELGFEAVPRV